MAQLIAPPFDSTSEADSPLPIPRFDETLESKGPVTPPAFDDAQPVEDLPELEDIRLPKEKDRPRGELSGRFLTGSAEGTLKPITMAARLGAQLNPLTKLGDWLATKTGMGITSTELVTELEGAASRASDDYGVDPKFNKNILSNIASAGGQLLPMAASAGFGLAPTVGALTAAEQGFQEADQAGAIGLQKVTSAGLNAGVAFLTERMLGMNALLKSVKASKMPTDTFKGLVKSVASQVGKSFFREGSQEMLEEITSDAIAKYIAAYDPDRDMFDPDKLVNVFVSSGIAGSGFGGVAQLAKDVSTIAPKAEMQDLAQSVDEGLVQVLQAEPPPITEVPPTVSQTPQGTPVLSPEEIQAVPEAKPGEVPVGAQPATPSVKSVWPELTASEARLVEIGPFSDSIRKKYNSLPKSRQQQIDRWFEANEQSLTEKEDVNWTRGRLDVLERWATDRSEEDFSSELVQTIQDIHSRYPERLRNQKATEFFAEAGRIAGNSGLSVDAIKDNVAVELKMIYGDDAPEMAEHLFGKIGKEPGLPSKPQFIGTAINTPKGPITGEAPSSAHLSMIDKALSKGSSVEEADLGFAFKRPDGTTEWVDRVEAGRRLTESGQLLGLPEGTPLTSEHIRNEVEGVTFKQTETLTPNESANKLEAFIPQAIAVARQTGATDVLHPEGIAREVQADFANKGQTDKAGFLDAVRKKTLNAIRDANRIKAGGKVTVSGDVEGETGITAIEAASTPVGPRSTTVSQEDISLIDQAISQLPENQSRVMRTLADNPDLTNDELSSQLGLTIDQVKKAKVQARASLLKYIQDNEIGKSMGPGAASASEILVQYEERKFGKRFQESEDITPEVRARTGDRYYEPIPNRVTAQRARELIELRGDEDVQKEIQDERSTISYADRSTVGQILIKKYNDQYKAIKDKKSDEALKLLDKAAELAEWAADFGTRLGQGVQSFAMWNRLSPDGKLRAYENIVKKKRANFIRENRNDVDEIKDAANTEGSPQKKLDALRKLNSPTAKKVRKKMGKLTQLGTLTDEKFLEATASELGLPVFDPDVQREILRLAHLIDEAPEGMPKMEATLELSKYLAQQKGFDPSDLLFGVYYGNILSGTGTQAVNLFDTTLNVLNETATLAIQNPKAASQITAALARGAASGRFDAMMAIMKGRKITDGKFVENPFFMEVAQFGKKGGVPIKTDTRTGRIAKRLTESKLAAPLNLWKLVGRLMSASDALAFRAAQEAKSAQLAWELANNGDQSIDQILGYDRIQEFQDQAKSEGYTGAQAQARASELMIMSRPVELQRASTDFASEGTYNVKPYGTIGVISNSIESLSRRIPAFKLIVPFTRIVGNVLNRGLNNSPYGYYRALRGKAGTRLDPKTFKEYSPEERNALMIRATASMAVITMIAVLHQTGAITISGAGPSDPEKKRQLRQTGWKPYTIKIGDRYYSYAFTPWAIALAATGNYMDNAKYQDFESKEGLDRAAYVFQAISGSLFNQSFLTGLSNFFDILGEKNPSAQINALRRWFAQTASSIAVPLSGFTKDVEYWTSGPFIPKVDSMKQALISQIPFASQTLRPQLNALGEPILANRGRFQTPANQDPVWKLIADKGLRVPVPNTFFDNPEEQYQYLKEQGGLLRKWIETNSSRLKNMDTKNAQDSLENAADAYRSRIRTKFLRKGALKKAKKGEV